MRSTFFAAVFALMAISSYAIATEQIPDDILLDGESSPLNGEPLKNLIWRKPENGGYKPEIPRSLCSASYRGYKAFWSVRDGRLSLDRLVYGPCAKEPQEIDMEALFPGQKPPVPASWYTGVLVVPRGKVSKNEGMGFQTTYERYLILVLKKGEVVSQVELDEPPQ